MRVDIDRRRILCLGAMFALSTSTVFVSQGAIGVTSQSVLVPQSPFPKADFSTTNLKQALASLDTSEPVPVDPRLQIDVPELVEDGARVPVSIDCAIEGVNAIALLAVANPFPLVATFEIPPGTLPLLSLRIKLQGSGEVIVIARTPQGFCSARRDLQVITGGCT